MLLSNDIDGKCWGRTDICFSDEIENFLGSALPPDLRSFSDNVGNAIIGPFNIVISGDQSCVYNSLTESMGLKGLFYERIGKALKILDHAGESYLYLVNSQSVVVYDTLNISPNYETMVFPSFSEFMEWVFSEAQRIKKSPHL